MSDSAVKVTENLNLSSMPTLTEMPSEGELPVEVVLAILYTMAKRLEKEALAQVLTGRSPKGEIVTYIRMVGTTIDETKGFVLAVPIQPESVGNVE